jgi:hypothetical protein
VKVLPEVESHYHDSADCRQAGPSRASASIMSLDALARARTKNESWRFTVSSP